jgi:hypothetical protein
VPEIRDRIFGRAAPLERDANAKWDKWRAASMRALFAKRFIIHDS